MQLWGPSPAPQPLTEAEGSGGAEGRPGPHRAAIPSAGGSRSPRGFQCEGPEAVGLRPLLRQRRPGSPRAVAEPGRASGGSRGRARRARAAPTMRRRPLPPLPGS